MFALGMSVKQATDIVDHINSTLTYSQHESLARDVLLSNKSVGNLVRSVGVYVCVASRLIRSVGVCVCLTGQRDQSDRDAIASAEHTALHHCHPKEHSRLASQTALPSLLRQYVTSCSVIVFASRGNKSLTHLSLAHLSLSCLLDCVMNSA